MAKSLSENCIILFVHKYLKHTIMILLLRMEQLSPNFNEKVSHIQSNLTSDKYRRTNGWCGQNAAMVTRWKVGQRAGLFDIQKLQLVSFLHDKLYLPKLLFDITTTKPYSFLCICPDLSYIGYKGWHSKVLSSVCKCMQLVEVLILAVPPLHASLPVIWSPFSPQSLECTIQGPPPIQRLLCSSSAAPVNEVVKHWNLAVGILVQNCS